MKSIRDSSGKVVKTLCSTEIYQNYDAHMNMCKANNMFLARLDTPEIEAAIIAYTNQKYATVLPGTFFMRGVQGMNWCKMITNTLSGKYNNYTVYVTACSYIFYAYCTFYPQEGKIFQFFNTFFENVFKTREISSLDFGLNAP